MPTVSTKPASTEGTASLDKALDVLDAVGNAPAGLSQAELATQLQLPRTTLYRLLGTLVARGLLRRDPLRRVYGLGMRCFEYARAAFTMPDLVAAAGAELRALRDMTGETAYLATLDGLDVVALERCDGAHPVRSAAALGQRKPLHCTSQGKAILAAMTADARDDLVRQLTLTALTPRSITDRRRLQAELRITAARGWSLDDEEIALGVRCCGAAVVDSAGQVRGAISVAGPAFRLTLARLELLGPEVAEAARRIGAQISAVQAPRRSGEAQAVEGHWAFEGAFPCWHDTQQVLYWADVQAPAVHCATAGGDRLLARVDSPITALLMQPQGVLARWGGHWHRVAADGTVQRATDMPELEASAYCLGAQGSVWACVAQQDRQGQRWRVEQIAGAAPGHGPGHEPGHEGWTLAEAATALAWDATTGLLYIAAAGSGTVWTAKPGQAALRRLATLPKGSGHLSGLAVDAHGGVWTALRGGWGVVRLEADGALDRMLALPVPCPTGLALAGADSTTLFVTSARDATSREALDAAPLSGRLFCVQAGQA